MPNKNFRRPHFVPFLFGPSWAFKGAAGDPHNIRYGSLAFPRSWHAAPQPYSPVSDIDPIGKSMTYDTL